MPKLSPTAHAYLITGCIATIVVAVLQGIRYVFGNDVYDYLMLTVFVLNIVIFITNVIVDGWRWSIWYTIMARVKARASTAEKSNSHTEP